MVEGKIFYVFSQNASPFEAGNAYSPFAVYTLLEHAGDYLAAAKVLAQEGYGESTTGDASTGTDWPTPEPLRRAPEPPEPFPLEALGKILYPAAQSIHEIIKAPAAICGQAVLAIANLTVQGHADILMDGRRIPLSEYLMSIALSGERKTGCDRAASVPVYAYERELLEAYKRDFRVYEKEALLWKKEHEAALKKSKDRREALEALSSAPVPPYYPQLTTEEPTYEGLTKSLGHGYPSIGIFSDEAGRFLGGYAMNQENKLKTIAGLSALWDGRPITRTRSADGSITLYGRRVCAHLLMQPLVAETILSDPLAHDQGFLSRCLITAPETTLGTQTYSAKDLNSEPGYKRYCDRLADILRTKLPLKIDPDTGHPTNELIPRDLLVSPEGKEVWIRFHDWVQEHLGESGVFRSISGIAAKAAEHALRLAGTIALVEDIETSTISFENIKAGIVLARFYLTEALRLFHAAKTNPDLLLAEKVFSWLRTRGSNHQLFSLPCIYQNGPNGVRDKATAARCVTILADHGWIRPLVGGAKIEGKRRRYVWEDAQMPKVPKFQFEAYPPAKVAKVAKVVKACPKEGSSLAGFTSLAEEVVQGEPPHKNSYKQVPMAQAQPEHILTCADCPHFKANKGPNPREGWGYCRKRQNGRYGCAMACEATLSSI